MLHDSASTVDLWLESLAEQSDPWSGDPAHWPVWCDEDRFEPDPAGDPDDTGEFAPPPSEDDPLERLAREFEPDLEPLDEPDEETKLPGVIPPGLAYRLAYCDCR